MFAYLSFLIDSSSVTCNFCSFFLFYCTMCTIAILMIIINNNKIHTGFVVPSPESVGFARTTQDVECSHLITLDPQDQRIWTSRTAIRRHIRVGKRTVLKYVCTSQRNRAYSINYSTRSVSS